MISSVSRAISGGAVAFLLSVQYVLAELRGRRECEPGGALGD